MKTSLILLLIFSISFLKAQTPLLKYMEIKGNSTEYLFYGNDKIESLTMVFIPQNQNSLQLFLVGLKSASFVKKINEESIKNDTNYVTIKLKKQPNAKEIRQYLETVAPEIIKINGKKFWVKSIMTQKEAQGFAQTLDTKNILFKAEYNDETNPMYYEFKINHILLKLKLMYQGDYPKYLYEGHVTKFMDMYDNIIKDQQEFLNHN